MMGSPAVLERLSKANDPKKALLKELGDLKNIEMATNRVLVAIYVGPEKMKSGLYRPPSAMKEDIYQAAVGLVVKMGRLAFRDDDNTKFHGFTVAEGDWVIFRPGDGKRIQIREVDCRIFEDTMLDLVIADPEIITHRT